MYPKYFHQSSINIFIEGSSPMRDHPLSSPVLPHGRPPRPLRPPSSIHSLAQAPNSVRESIGQINLFIFSLFFFCFFDFSICFAFAFTFSAHFPSPSPFLDLLVYPYIIYVNMTGTVIVTGRTSLKSDSINELSRFCWFLGLLNEWIKRSGSKFFFEEVGQVRQRLTQLSSSAGKKEKERKEEEGRRIKLSF